MRWVAADSGSLYGSLGHYPAQKNIPPGTMRDIYGWDASQDLGSVRRRRGCGRWLRHTCAVA